MPEEQINELLEILKNVKRADILSAVAVGILIILMLAECIYFCIKYQKVNKMLEQYYLTLNEEEKKKLKMYKEIKKL